MERFPVLQCPCLGRQDWDHIVRAWYHVNSRKALETILWFTSRRNPLDFYHILKILFFADKKHLNEYGRPILGDTYDADPHGPVARTVYHLMKQDDPLEVQFLAEQLALADGYPIVLEDRYWVSGQREPDLSYFSPSDIEALEWAYIHLIDKSFDELERLTHADKAWRNARERGEVIRYEDMLDVGDNEKPRAERQLVISSHDAAIRRRTVA